ncbi:hypothetical protein NA57DRAFT_51769 [Rhizodiscina lignyota]|uniref:Uncharacterized protein n=1 Tax=Rhizodiscina lignyota TaxID=1504668 RepID=A0A9P4MF05_9PEZI|nr:hypothetical protein NA57DRAFT_51769 [Rhizodiscina lignyota]
MSFRKLLTVLRSVFPSASASTVRACLSLGVSTINETTKIPTSLFAISSSYYFLTLIRNMDAPDGDQQPEAPTIPDAPETVDSIPSAADGNQQPNGHVRRTYNIPSSSSSDPRPETDLLASRRLQVHPPSLIPGPCLKSWKDMAWSDNLRVLERRIRHVIFELASFFPERVEPEDQLMDEFTPLLSIKSGPEFKEWNLSRICTPDGPADGLTDESAHGPANGSVDGASEANTTLVPYSQRCIKCWSQMVDPIPPTGTRYPILDPLDAGISHFVGIDLSHSQPSEHHTWNPFQPSSEPPPEGLDGWKDIQTALTLYGNRLSDWVDIEQNVHRIGVHVENMERMQERVLREMNIETDGVFEEYNRQGRKRGMEAGYHHDEITHNRRSKEFEMSLIRDSTDARRIQNSTWDVHL